MNTGEGKLDIGQAPPERCPSCDVLVGREIHKAGCATVNAEAAPAESFRERALRKAKEQEAKASTFTPDYLMANDTMNLVAAEQDVDDRGWNTPTDDRVHTVYGLPTEQWRLRAEAVRLAQDECNDGLIHKTEILDRAREIAAFLAQG